MTEPRMKFPKFICEVDKVTECYHCYKPGDRFEFKDFTHPPEHFCGGAYHQLFPVMYAWTFGAQFPFMDKEGWVRTTCPDGGKLVFKTKAVWEDSE